MFKKPPKKVAEDVNIPAEFRVELMEAYAIIDNVTRLPGFHGIVIFDGPFFRAANGEVSLERAQPLIASEEPPSSEFTTKSGRRTPEKVFVHAADLRPDEHFLVNLMAWHATPEGIFLLPVDDVSRTMPVPAPEPPVTWLTRLKKVIQPE